MFSPPEQQVEPGLALRRWVAGLGVVSSETPCHHEALYPPCAEPAILVRWSGREGVHVNVIGPLTRGRHKSFPAPRLYVRVALRAGHARALLGVPLHALADRIVALEELWAESGTRLRGALASSDLTGAVGLLEMALLERLRASEDPRAHGALLSRAMRCLDGGAERIAVLAHDLGLSERHLRRLFQEELGMTPKHYARISRLRRVLFMQGASPEPWAQLALEAGFHDQSHLIREFRDLLAVTPELLRQRETAAKALAAVGPGRGERADIDAPPQARSHLFDP